MKIDIVLRDLHKNENALMLELLRLSERKPKDQGKLVITQREIGQMVGMSRESANKQLRAWAKLRWVKLERGGIVVLAPEALAMVAAAAADEPDL